MNVDDFKVKQGQMSTFLQNFVVKKGCYFECIVNEFRSVTELQAVKGK